MLLDPILIVEGLSAPCALEGGIGVVLSVGDIVDPLLNVPRKMSGQALDGPGRGVAEGANSVALDLTGDLLEHGNFPLVGLALLHPLEDGLEPARALSAGGALAARLVLVEVGEPARSERGGVCGVKNRGEVGSS